MCCVTFKNENNLQEEEINSLCTFIFLYISNFYFKMKIVI